MIIGRRGFLAGLGLLVAAPAIIKVENLMKLPKREIIRPQKIFAVVSMSNITPYHPNCHCIIEVGHSTGVLRIGDLVSFGSDGRGKKWEGIAGMPQGVVISTMNSEDVKIKGI